MLFSKCMRPVISSLTKAAATTIVKKRYGRNLLGDNEQPIMITKTRANSFLKRIVLVKQRGN